ncbi:hypothetical protein C8Q72DRAFT_622447 [Fomitopsis betulina]|nr:hypothetical protein C8Q72DRAFT_622447 [Fomitopsis betulina]
MNATSRYTQHELLFADVPDPTDFPPPGIAPGLRLLDEALRCNVCHELYDAPVTLYCGHCFCSLCVRNCLKEKEECPSCRKPATDTQLRKNVVLENAVKAWAVARESTLRLAKQEAQRLAGDAEERPSRPKKRRRLVRSSGDSSSDGVEIVDGPSTSRHTEKKQRATASPHTPDSSTTPSTPPTPSTSDGLVDCPMCQRRVPLQIINQHIDSRCKLTAPPSPRRPKGKAKQEWSKILGGDHRPGKERTREKSRLQPDEDSEPDYLPTVSYHTLKDKRVQELLHEHGLPTTGDRPAWVRRHRQWLTLYNANLDRDPADRRAPEQLRRELQRWEATEGGGAVGNGAGKKKVAGVEDVVAYQTAHKAEFAQLIEAARPKRTPRAEEPAQSEAISPRSQGERGASTTNDWEEVS